MRVIVNDKQFKKYINETRGHVSATDEWSKIIVDSILKELFDITDKNTIFLKDLKDLYSDKEFFITLPINSINIDVVVNKIEGDEGSADASFKPSSIKISDDNLVEDVTLTLNIDLPTEISSNDVNMKNYLYSMFSHELLHVYEWFKRKLKDPKENKECNEVFMSGDINGNIIDRIAFLLYAQLSYEMNAFVNQVSSILKQRGIKTYKEFMSELKDIFVWDFVEGMEEFEYNKALKEIEDLPEDEFEKLYSIIGCYYSVKGKEDLRRKHITLEIFLKDIEKTFKIRGQVLKRKLLKIASDIL
jgi:hypothetical protein